MSDKPEWFEITENDPNPEPKKSNFSKTLAAIIAVPLSLALLVGGAHVFAEGDDDDRPGNVPTLSNKTVNSESHSKTTKTSNTSKKSSNVGTEANQIESTKNSNAGKINIDKPVGNFADPNSSGASKLRGDDGFEDHENGEHESGEEHEDDH